MENDRGEWRGNLSTIMFIIKILLLRSIRLPAFLLIGFSLLLSFFPVLDLVLLRALINSIQLGGSFSVKEEFVVRIFLFMLLLQFIKYICDSLRTYLTQVFHMKINNHVTELIMTQVSRMRLDSLYSAETQNQLYFLRTQSTMQVGTIMMGLVNTIASILTFLSMFVYLFSWNESFALIAAASSVPVGIVQVVFNKKSFLLSQYLNRFNREQFYLIFISTTVEYMREIIQYTSMKYLVRLHAQLFKIIFFQTKQLLLKQQFSIFVSSMIALAGMVFVEYRTVLLAISGSILIGTFTSIMQALAQVSGGMQEIILSISGLHNDWLYIFHLQEFIKNSSEDEDEEVKTPTRYIDDLIPSKSVHIRAEDLAYSIDGRELFCDVSFDFRAGARVGIKGGNGSGKSTLFQLIQGFKNPTSGKLLFNGVNIASITKEIRLQLCQTLHQRPSSYELSLNENIGISDVDLLSQMNEDIMNYVRNIDSDSFLLGMGLSGDTRIGEWYDDSHNLSGGQWQKIALYRLFFKRAPVYLLDEPTNNLDEKSIDSVVELIRLVPEDSTVIIISHDEQFLQRVCRDVYMLDRDGFHQVMSCELESVSVD